VALVEFNPQVVKPWIVVVVVGREFLVSGLMRQIDRGQTCWNVEDGAGVEKVLEAISLK